MLPPQGQPLPFSNTCSISANYRPFSTKFSRIIFPRRWQRMGKKMLKNDTPLGAAPPTIFSNAVNYLISLAIMNEYRWNFQELVYWLGEEKWVKKYLNMSPPPGAATAALGGENFRFLFTWTRMKNDNYLENLNRI